MSDFEGLIGLLKEKTFDGKLKWQLAGDNRISTKQGSNIIDVYNGGSYYQIILRNGNGVTLSHENYPFGVTRSAEALKQLFEKARRDALGIDEAITDVKQRLLQL